MSVSSRFAVGIHILSLVEINKSGLNTSEFLASSVNTNPALIRKIIGLLKKAELLDVKPGVPGAKLAKELDEITLFDVYKAVDVMNDKELFNVHKNPNPDCPVGRNIQSTIEPLFQAAQLAMEKVLSQLTLDDVIKDIVEKNNKNTDKK